MVDDGEWEYRKLRNNLPVRRRSRNLEGDQSSSNTVLAVLEPRALSSPEDRRLDWFRA